MFEIPIKIKVGYNRKCDVKRDFFKIITIMATDKAVAIGKVENYSTNGIFDQIEDDYIEDTLYVVG